MILMLVTSLVPNLTSLVPKIIGDSWDSDTEVVFGVEMPSERYLHTVLIGLFLLNVAAIGLSMLQQYLVSVAGERLAYRLRSHLYQKMGAVGAQALANETLGGVAQRLTGDIVQVQQLLTIGILSGVSALLQLVYASLLLVYVDARGAVSLMLALPILYMLMRVANRRLVRAASADRAAHEGILTRFIEAIAGYRDLLASGRFDELSSEFHAELAEKQRRGIRISIVGGFAGIAPIAFFVCLIYGYYIWSTSSSSPNAADRAALLGAMVAFVALLSRIADPARQLSAVVSEVSGSIPSFIALEEALTAPEMLDSPKAVTGVKRDIVIEQLGFAYRTSSGPRRALTDISASIPEGSFTAIVGESGSGKTTLALLLARLCDATEGRILLGGVDIREYPLRQLRRTVSFIPQNPFMFDRGIIENILMGIPEQSISPQMLRRAISIARLDDLLERREHSPGEGGTVGARLSGGEKQRVALARALVIAPDIIICDEHVANVDIVTASAIRAALNNEFANKTRIVVTHQLATIRGADQILLLRGGCLAAAGKHPELMSADAGYRDLWRLQDGVENGEWQNKFRTN